MTRQCDPIPPSQLFRALLLHMLDTHRVLAPIVATSTSVPLKLCHQQNAYILSEIESWLVDLPEGSDLTPEFSTVQSAELQRGLALCWKETRSDGGATISSAKDALQSFTPRGSRRAASSRRSESTPRAWERNSSGQIVFPSQSSSAKPASTSPIPTSDTSRSDG